MGELVIFRGCECKNLWANLGSCSICMNKCDVATFLIYISAVSRLVAVLNVVSMQWTFHFIGPLTKAG